MLSLINWKNWLFCVSWSWLSAGYSKRMLSRTLQVRGSDSSLPKYKHHALINYHATFNKLHIISLSSFENGATLEPFQRVWKGLHGNVCKAPRERHTLVLQNVKKFAFAELDLLMTFSDQFLPTLKVFFSFFFWDKVSWCHYCWPQPYIEQASLELRDQPSSASPALGLKVCATSSSLSFKVFSKTII